MENWLVTHALENVWCKPYNDFRWLISPTRITKETGELYGVNSQGYSVRLPKMDTWFHVFHLGKLNHDAIGIEYLFDQWIRIDRLVNHWGVLVKLYNELGRTFPLSYAWLRKQPNGNVLICLEMVTNQADFSHERLFVRFYNSYFTKTESFNSDYASSVTGNVVRSDPVRTDMVNLFQSLQQRAGEPIAYVNGWEVDVLTKDDIKMWDFVEVVYDGLAESIHYFDIKDLLSFYSDLDGKRKYLLHPPKQLDTIKFINDIEVSVLEGNYGVHYHQHRADSFRQVTHNDYSLDTSRISTYVENSDLFSDSTNMTLKVTVHRSGMDRPIIWEDNRIHELYKLSDNDIVKSMAGMDSHIPEWRASHLEQSAYNRIMASSYQSIDNQIATDCYGYNAIARYSSGSPVYTEVVGGELVAKLSPFHARKCTAFEYNSDGHLLGYYHHTGKVDAYYRCQHQNCHLVETVEGHGGKVLDIIESNEPYVPEHGVNYRVYTNKLLSGTPSFEYEDITDSDKYGKDESGKLIWNLDLTRRLPVIWTDKTFLLYEFDHDIYDGHIKFSIDHWTDENNYRPLKMEPETLEIWLNRRFLVEGVDYHVVWPQVVICNKKYLEGTGDERHNVNIVVRCRGLADKRRIPKTGFVVNGLLSNNSVYDVRDDKPLHISMGGSVCHRGEIMFREDAHVGATDKYNGLPYSVNDPTVPLRGLTVSDTYDIRDKSRDLDGRIEDYLTNKLPTPPDIEHNPSGQWHTLFSPIMNKIIHDMINGHLEPVADDELYYISTRQFDTLMEPYMYLLDYEPALSGIDLRYVHIAPHDNDDVIALTPIKLALVERLNDRYLDNRVNLTKHLRVEE
jgi:hypothetical protein